MQTNAEPTYRFPVDMPASLKQRLQDHKDKTGESMRQVIIKGTVAYLDDSDARQDDK